MLTRKPELFTTTEHELAEAQGWSVFFNTSTGRDEVQRLDELELLESDEQAIELARAMGFQVTGGGYFVGRLGTTVLAKMACSIQLDGTSLRVEQDDIVHATPATNLPEGGWFVRPMNGWSDGIEHHPEDSIYVSDEELVGL